MLKFMATICFFLTINAHGQKDMNVQTNKINFAWLNEINNISVIFESNLTPKQLNDIRVTDNTGQRVQIRDRRLNVKRAVLVTEKLDLKKNYKVIYKDKELFTYPSRHLLNKYFHTTEPLGLTFTARGNMNFSLWSPTATNVLLYIYKKDGGLLTKRQLVRYDKGLWKASVYKIKGYDGEFDELYYSYQVTAFDEKYIVADPYGLSAKEFTKKNRNLRSAIIDLKNIERSGEKRKSNLMFLDNNPMNFVGYEAHIRDVTMKDPKLTDKERGTYEGITKGFLDHVKDLGATHIQLMPTLSFNSVNEVDRSYQNKNITTRSMNYNWGYDPQHFFTLSGHYSKYPKDAYSRIFEFQNMVNEFHKNNIGVIVDVVYNHLNDGLAFEMSAPGCYLRRKPNGEISNGSFAGYTFDSKIFMARRMIIDSLEYQYHVLGVDGFRFDLMSLIDVDTMKLIRKRLGKDVILYGEAWESTDLPKAEASTKTNMPSKTISAFNDGTRESYIGMESKGVILGDKGASKRAYSSIFAGIKGRRDKETLFADDSYQNFADSPQMTMSYVSIHDGPTLWDKIRIQSNEKDFINKQYYKQAYAMLFSTQGKLILHAGDEMGRSKPYFTKDSNSNTSTKLQTGELVQLNSYKSSDDTNAIDWDLKKINADIYQYVKGLVAIRKQIPALHYSTSTNVKRGITFFGFTPPKKQVFKNTHKSFREIKSLTLNFKNGPKNSTYYIVGEIHLGENKNPSRNKYKLTFDKNGSATITLSDVNKINSSAWSSPESIDIKLVKTPGKWDELKGSYTPNSNNTIYYKYIKRSNNEVNIDLAIPNHVANSPKQFTLPDYMAYVLNNRLETKNPVYKDVIVIHNFSNETLKIKSPIKLNKFEIIVDKNMAEYKGISSSVTKIEDNYIYVQNNSSTFIGIK